MKSCFLVLVERLQAGNRFVDQSGRLESRDRVEGGQTLA